MYDHLFWSKGLKFTCQQCGGCCKGAPGTIYFAPEEIDALIEGLGVDREEFLATHFRPFRDSYTARDDFDDGRCIFLKDDRCSIYEYRPIQCRAFPFWRTILRSQRRWNYYAKECPGMNQGKLYTAEEIAEIAANSTV